MESVHYVQFVRYLRRLQDDLENFIWDMQSDEGEIDLHDYSFNLEPLQQVMEGKIILLTGSTDLPKAIESTALLNE